MNIANRYSTPDGLRGPAIIRDVVIAIGILILLMMLWPFYSVPTGSRGVITTVPARSSALNPRAWRCFRHGRS